MMKAKVKKEGGETAGVDENAAGVNTEGENEEQGAAAEDGGEATDDAAAEDGGEATDDTAEDAGGREAEDAGESADVKYIRLAADFQNYKKRVEKERYERYSEGKKDFAADMLPILDNFDRALSQNAALADDEHDRAVIEGMDMILKQFLDALAKNGVSEIAALGEAFDPNVHHAVLMEPSEGYESQTVSEVFQKGYRIGDKVIRPAMVKVAE